MFPRPIIDPAIATIAPGFHAVSLFADARGTTPVAIDPSVLADACRFVAEGGPVWAEAHLASWAETYTRFGAKPNRTPCSAQALRKRVLKDGTLPAINPVVDLYNAASLRFAVPVGGENIEAYAGAPRLTIADGSEPFDTIANGEPAIEYATLGEVIWRDDVGVTCRRWNWRQGSRTRLDTFTGRMWFVLESLDTMPLAALDEAATFLELGLRTLIPGCFIAREPLAA
ncbi:B3/4 domain-containing protein (plasmid) [Sphingomonas aliaeris]|uniref:B3/4 domain-containing protein n=1 Tax=Sphingomonas aliaeris TaxID=2759526 RepID=A0A974NYM2_9SPHN|nr:B3/4 domain-containing protein [Sphingomonas aliaeris]QQV79489.1 B3/4 domain-containing protein [Sphingomonas aliaeris]